MTWREDLREASYRGVPFGVRAADGETGRRTTVHSFPQREAPYVEDHGRRPVEFQVEGFVLGEDYMRTRDRLIRVCRQPPPGYPFGLGGLLVHPYLGKLRVVCTSVRWRESADEGGMARFSMTFVEAGGEANPLAQSDPVGRSDRQAAVVTERAEEVVTGELEVTGPESIREASQAALEAIGGILLSGPDLSGNARDTAALAQQAAFLIQDAATLATTPAQLATAVTDGVGQVLDAAQSAEAALSTYEALLALVPAVTGGTGRASLAADANAALVTNLARQAGAAGAVRAAARISWPSLDEALEAQARLGAAIDDLSAEVADGSYEALQGLRAALARAVPPDAQKLPRLRSLRLARSEPALVVAYRLYDDRSREQEILDRNRVRRPAFLPALTPIQVLSS